MELKVRAVVCLKCGYTAETQRGSCSEAKHNVMRVEAEKHFFACKGCKRQRCTTLGGNKPDSACSGCGQWKWERCGMFTASVAKKGIERFQAGKPKEVFSLRHN